MNIIDAGAMLLGGIANQGILKIENYDSNQVDVFTNQQKEDSLLAKASNVLKNVSNLSLSSLPSKAVQGIKNMALSDGIMVVQYNPKSIKYEGTCTGSQNVKSEGGTKITTISHASTIKVSFELVFHSTYLGDTSVKDKMNLLLNMLYQTPEKKVSFSWSTLSIEGQVTAFSGKYDMFDATGNPISGSMNLTIQSQMSTKDVNKVAEAIDQEQDEK